jgi:hypothetical protein
MVLQKQLFILPHEVIEKLPTTPLFTRCNPSHLFISHPVSFSLSLLPYLFLFHGCLLPCFAMDGDVAAFCTKEMDRVLFQRGVPIGVGVTTVGHGRGAAATGHAAAPADPGRGVAAVGLGRGASAAAPTDPGRGVTAIELGRGASTTGHAAVPADPGRGFTAAGLGHGASATGHIAGGGGGGGPHRPAWL